MHCMIASLWPSLIFSGSTFSIKGTSCSFSWSILQTLKSDDTEQIIFKRSFTPWKWIKKQALGMHNTTLLNEMQSDTTKEACFNGGRRRREEVSPFYWVSMKTSLCHVGKLGLQNCFLQREENVSFCSGSICLFSSNKVALTWIIWTL